MLSVLAVMRELFQVPLNSLTTLRLGGMARRVVTAESEQELQQLVSVSTPVLVLGGGSNLVVADNGFDGDVVRLAMSDIQIERASDCVRVEVGAGAQWDDFVEHACADNLAGIECLAGIPGQVGATPIQNVGAYGQEVADVLAWVRVFDRHECVYRVLPKSECGFAYRHSIFKNNPRYVVTRVCFELVPSKVAAMPRYPELVAALDSTTPALSLVRQTVVALRRKKGMVVDAADPDSQSAGSFFTNPVLTRDQFEALTLQAGRPVPHHLHGHQIKVPAAWLVEQAGFHKGLRQGGVGVSSKHALALVNHGGTTGELLALARAIVQRVHQQFGVTLVPEPVFVGTTL